MNSFIGLRANFTQSFMDNKYRTLGIDGFYEFRNTLNLSSSINIENTYSKTQGSHGWWTVDANVDLGYPIFKKRMPRTRLYPKAGLGYRHSTIPGGGSYTSNNKLVHHWHFVYGDLGISASKPILKNFVVSVHGGYRFSFTDVYIRDEKGNKFDHLKFVRPYYNTFYVGLGIGYILTKSTKTITPHF